jgi:transposase, IS5 family
LQDCHVSSAESLQIDAPIAARGAGVIRSLVPRAGSVPMRPKPPDPVEQVELFRARLDNLVDRRHPLVRLAGLIDWHCFEESFGALYTEGVGRPGLPTRLMVGLHLLKHMDGLSDEAVCARYLDSPYVQLFCGETYFQHVLPLDRSSMTRWRQRIGAERMEALLAESLAAARRGGAVEDKHLRRITVDTTVMPKAVTHPTDSKLLHRGIEWLARLARRHRVRLRQSYLRVAKHAKREAARLIHSGRPRQAERLVRRLRTWLGRLARDIARKVAADPAMQAIFAKPLALIGRLLRQRRDDRGSGKLYSLHAPEVECIGRGKARARFEFGVKVSLAATNARAPGGQFVVGARSLPGNPYDGHTLAAQIAQTERLTGLAVERVYVDRGYRGHDADRARVFISRQKRGLTPTIRRELRRRNAIEMVCLQTTSSV